MSCHVYTAISSADVDESAVLMKRSKGASKYPSSGEGLNDPMLEVLSVQEIHGQWTFSKELAKNLNIPETDLKATDIVQVSFFCNQSVTAGVNAVTSTDGDQTPVWLYPLYLTT